MLSDGTNVSVSGNADKDFVAVPAGAYDSVLKAHETAYKSRPEIGPRTSGLIVKDESVVKVRTFDVLPASRRGIGYGSNKGIPLVPFRTVAADIGAYKTSDKEWKDKGGLVPRGTKVFIQEFVGKAIPDLLALDGSPLPTGTTHDGWFIVNDTGGHIFGVHFDIFVGDKAHYQTGLTPKTASVWFDGISDRIEKDYVYGLKKP